MNDTFQEDDELPTTPRIVFDKESQNIFKISIEESIITSRDDESGDQYQSSDKTIVAFASLMATYYVYNLEYEPMARNSLYFIER